MKNERKYNRIIKVVFILMSIMFMSSPIGSISTINDNEQIILIDNVSHSANTAIIEFEQFVDYYLSSGDNVFLILLYGDSDSMKGAVIVEITTDNLVSSKYSIHNPVINANSWFDLDESMVEISGNAIFVDFQDYNIAVGPPQIIRILALSSSETLDDFITGFQTTVKFFISQFQDSVTPPPNETSSTSIISTTDQSTAPDISNTDITNTDPNQTDPNNFSTSPGFEFLIIFLSSILFLVQRKLK